jgi:pSer/pThr/pTyr-binding forkhead associated (FHA) protein/DNA-binding CsgD family transcriptional regulator
MREPVTEPHGSSPGELKERIAAERRGTPFLVYRDGEGDQRVVQLEPYAPCVTVGRRSDSDLALIWDPEVSRVHAQIERVGGEWILHDDGLSRNGSYLNGERVVGRRRLRDGDRLCFGETPIVFRAPADAEAASTAAVAADVSDLTLTPTQRKIVVALCRPMKASSYAMPASNREIAEEVSLSIDAVKAHLRVLFERLGMQELPQNRKRASLAAAALVRGLVSERDF